MKNIAQASTIALLLLLCLTTGSAAEGDPLADMDLGATNASANQPQQKSGLSLYGLSLSGYVETRNQIRLRDIGEPLSLRQRVWLESPFVYGPFHAFVSGLAEAEVAAPLWTGRHSVARIELREAYVLWDTSWFDLTVGKKLVRWGVTDGVTTLDLINPVDTRDPIANARTSTRLPVPLIDMELALGHGLTAEAVVIPRAEINKLPGFGDPWEFPGLHRLRKEARRGALTLAVDTPRSPEFAFRLTQYQSGYDFGLAYYSGFVDAPVFAAQFTAASPPRVTIRYPYFQAYGANVAIGLPRSTLRGEFAYKPRFPFSRATGSFVKRDYLQTVIGWDRTFFTNLYVNLQGFSNNILNAARLLVQDAHSYGFTFSVSDKFLRDDLTAGLRGLYGINDNGVALELFGEYALGDHWKINAGVLFFEGEKDRGVGVFDRNDFFSLRTAYVF